MKCVSIEQKQLILETLAKKIELNTFNTWCKDMNFVELEDGCIQVPVPNIYYKNFIDAELVDSLQEAYSKVTGKATQITTKVDPNSTEIGQNIKKAPQNIDRVQPTNYLLLNDNFTFDTFIIGSSNRFAYAAACSVTETPCSSPLFIYGGCGLGKTHLLQAICHSLIEKYPKKRSLYIPCEAFINDFIQAIKQRDVESFRVRYKSIDFLLIDDVELLSRKESTQEEFFQLFNYLHMNKRLVVMSSDGIPARIPALKERLFSRFQGGLIAGIEPPALEMRIAIIKSKLERLSEDLPEDVINFIAEKISSNIRILEGAITQLVGYRSLLGYKIDLNIAKEILKDRVQENHKSMNMTELYKMVANFFDISYEDLFSESRTQSLILTRHVCAYVAYKFTNSSMQEIAERLKLSSRSSILYSVRKIEKLYRSDENVRSCIDHIKLVPFK